MIPDPTLTTLEEEYAIHRLDSSSRIPSQVLQSDTYFIGKTEEELSIVCRAEIPVESEASDAGWSCLKVLGPLDLSLTGILAGISGVLSAGNIVLFAVSTFDTDYILVRSVSLPAAKRLLSEAGYDVI